jgi:hypothetical protein
MPALLVVVAVVALLVGAVVGWAVTVRGPARWCGRCGESLRCLTCSPLPAPVPVSRPSTVEEERDDG